MQLSLVTILVHRPSFRWDLRTDSIVKHDDVKRRVAGLHVAAR
jgi:hypothetical protein